MVLKSLELSGFKSFAKKTPLFFDSPVTAIVGPNGSGKSNVVEAIRFVLGEQSIKSLRGKGGSDLIFKGSKSLSALARASVTIVFDNRKRIFTFARGGEQEINLDFEEIAISREVFSDGTNSYRINGSEVRLKDIIELLSSVNIGASGHHIISQGEADRILNANAKDRRAMVEDALGLKVYQYRLKESERKLEKTQQNMKEVQSLRREIAPHLAFLKKQVEKIEKSQELRSELGLLLREYLGRESYYIRTERARLATHKKTLIDKHHQITRALEAHEASTKQESRSFSVAPLEKEARDLAHLKDELSRKIGRLEGTLLALENANQKESHGEVEFSELESLLLEIEEMVETALKKPDEVSIKIELSKIKEHCKNFIARRKSHKAAPEANTEIEELKASHEALLAELKKLGEKEKEIEKTIHDARKAHESEQETLRKSEREYYTLKTKETELHSEEKLLLLEEEALEKTQALFLDELKEAEVLVGQGGKEYEEIEEKGEREVVRRDQEERHKKLERIKIKIEDAGSLGGNDVLKEYEEVKHRDEFLSKEVLDIDTSLGELRILIRELKETIDTEFKSGIEKINTQFQEFFALMFGGGSAFLSVVVEHKRAKKTDEEEEVASYDEEDLEFERGIEINVSLPQKKVKDLNMLSGGERSLTSIALLFAMSQVNPPPFLVLDETDAALDEANSRKYGNMIENLSQYSQLILVTHNRETMSRAKILYGVTIGADGASKLLSIKFEEAAQIAK